MNRYQHISQPNWTTFDNLKHISKTYFKRCQSRPRHVSIDRPSFRRLHHHPTMFAFACSVASPPAVPRAPADVVAQGVQDPGFWMRQVHKMHLTTVWYCMYISYVKHIQAWFLSIVRKQWLALSFALSQLDKSALFRIIRETMQSKAALVL